MINNTIDNTEIKKLIKISINIDEKENEEENNEIKKINSSNVISFHFEEGISFPYTGIIKLKTNEYVKISNIDLNNLTIKIEYSLIYKTKENENKTETRQIYSLIKKISSLPRIEKDSYYYLICLESPLDRLINKKNEPYKNKRIEDILELSLITENDEQINADFSNLSNLPDSQKNIIQLGEKTTLNFINRILIGYGINYIFNFKNPDHKISLIFSNSNDFSTNKSQEKEKNQLYFTDELSNLINKSDLIYCPDVTYENNNIKIKDAIEYSKRLRNHWINIESDTSDQSEQTHFHEYYKNICIRKLASNATLILNNIQDIRIEPGCIIKNYSNNDSCKYLVRSVITDISCNKKNILLQKINCIELNDPYYIKNNFTNIKDNNDYFDFNPSIKFGCLIPQKFVKFEEEENKSSLNIIKAVACSKDGKSEPTNSFADSVTGLTESDLFYAYIKDNDKKIIILVHSLVNQSASNVSKIYRGKEILVLENNGTYYLYGFLPNYFEEYESRFSNIDNELLNLNSKVKASTLSFSDNKKYVCSLIMNGELKLANAIKTYAAKTFDYSIYEDKYKEKFEEKVKKLYNEYDNAYSNLNNLFLRIKDLKSKTNLTESEEKELENLEEENKTLKNKVFDKTDKNSIIYRIEELATQIIDECDIDFVKTGISTFLFESHSGFKFDSVSGDFEICANNISLISNNSITLNGKNIFSKGEKTVTSSVGFSSINTKSNGTTISTGSTINGKQLNEDGTDQSNMLSSELKIATYKGISASAYNIKLTGHNGVSLHGPLKAGISLGYGTVKVIGSEIKLETQSRSEQLRNIFSTSSTFIHDIVCSKYALKEKKGFKISNYICNNLIPSIAASHIKLYKLDNTIQEKIPKKWNTVKNTSAGYKETFDGDVIESTTKDKIYAYIDFIDVLIKTLFDIYDFIMDLVRNVLKIYDMIDDFSDVGKVLDQIDLYASHIKMGYTLLVAGIKVFEGKITEKDYFLPSVSEFSINCSTAELKAANIGFEVNKEDSLGIAPMGGTVRHSLRETLTKRVKIMP